MGTNLGAVRSAQHTWTCESMHGYERSNGQCEHCNEQSVICNLWHVRTLCMVLQSVCVLPDVVDTLYQTRYKSLIKQMEEGRCTWQEVAPPHSQKCHNFQGNHSCSTINIHSTGMIPVLPSLPPYQCGNVYCTAAIGRVRPCRTIGYKHGSSACWRAVPQHGVTETGRRPAKTTLLEWDGFPKTQKGHFQELEAVYPSRPPTLLPNGMGT